MKKILAFTVFICSLSFPSIVRAELPVYPTAPFDAPCFFTYAGETPYPNNSTSSDVRVDFAFKCKGPTEDPSQKDYKYTYGFDLFVEVSFSPTMRPLINSWNSGATQFGAAAFNVPSSTPVYFRATVRAVLRSDIYSNTATNPSTGCCFWSRPLYSSIISAYTNPNNVGTITTVAPTTTTTTTTVAPVVQQQTPPQAPVTPTLSYTVLNDTTVKISWNSTGKTYELCPMSSNKLINGQWVCTSIQITDQTFILWPLAQGKTESFGIIAVNGAHQFVNGNFISCVDPSCFIFSPWSNWTSVTNNYNTLITTTTVPQITTTVPQTTTTVAPWKYVPYVEPWKYVYKKVLQTVYSNVRTGAICRDGSSSGSTGRGTCSWHGGVNKWLTLPPKKVYVNKKYKCYLNQTTNQYTRNCVSA